jgi:hypothetical protein
MQIHTYAPSGQVYVLSRPDSTSAWSFLKNFTSPNLLTYKNFGVSIASSYITNVLMIGAPSWSFNTIAGAVLIYSLPPSDRSSPSLQGVLQAPDPAGGDMFGNAIALGSDAVFIGTRDAGIYAHPPLEIHILKFNTSTYYT